MIEPCITPTRILLFKACKVDVWKDHVDSSFIDGSVSSFWPMAQRPELKQYIRDVRKMGFIDPMQFGIEHDITHHWMAETLGWKHSHVIWASAHNLPHDSEDLFEEEEYFVNNMLRYIQTGKSDDDDFGVLRETFGDRLSLMATCLWHVLRGG